MVPAILAPNPEKMTNSPSEPVVLDKEEQIEQAYFFATLAERLHENVPTQEILSSVREEILATTKLPMAIDFLLAELKHVGTFGSAMSQLSHYFRPFQCFVIQVAEDDKSRFDLRIGLQILQREAEYRSGVGNHAKATPAGIFMYQFEAICRNRLGYDEGLEAVANDPVFDETWHDWILRIRRQIGMVDIADLIYVHSEAYKELGAPAEGEESPERVVLFGEQEGRIALANRRKDPLYLFSSLNRQLGYPKVPQSEKPEENQDLLPQLARRLERMEKRLRLVEEEQRGGIDLTQFYEPPPEEPQ